MKLKNRLIALTACIPFVLPVLQGCGQGSAKAPDDPDPVPVEDENANEPLSDGVAGVSRLLAAARAPQTATGEQGSGFYTLRDATVRFAGTFIGKAYELYGSSARNMAVSPASLYMALGITAATAAGDTKAELLSALGVSEAELAAGYDALCRSLAREWTSYSGDNEGRIEVSNSVWLADGVEFKRSKLDELAQSYYCSTYSADFADNNVEANSAVKEYVRKSTHGLIDKSFELPRSTVFTIVNALYVKDIWMEFGEDIFVTDTAHTFRTGTGASKNTKLMTSRYIPGRTLDHGDFTSFHARTKNGVDISFMLPKPGATDVFTADSFAALARPDKYIIRDDQKREAYFTRCLFPKFKADFDSDVRAMLSSMGITKLFTEECDMSALTDTNVRCGKLQHVTDLTVDRKGIEGAAVTVVEMAGTGAPVYDDYTKIYEEFEVNGAFGYCISYQGVPLFTGVVNDIQTI